MHLGSTIWRLGLLASVVAAGCGESRTTVSSADPCDRDPITVQQNELAADPDLAVCPQDVVMLLLQPNATVPGHLGAGIGAIEVPIRYTRAQRVEFCVDRFGVHPHRAALLGLGGRQLLEIASGGCEAVDVSAGVYHLRITHGNAGRSGVASTFVFVRPGAVSPGTAGTSPMELTTSVSSSAVLFGPTPTPTPKPLTLITSDCPGCDFRGQNFTGEQVFCHEPCTYANGCLACDPSFLHCQGSAVGVVGDLSGSRWAGAHMDGITLCGVNLSGATFSDDEFGPASLKTYPFPAGPIGPDFLEDDMRGASFVNADLRQVGFCGSTQCSGDEVNAPFSDTSVAGADFRGADLSGLDLHGHALAGALFDVATNLAGTNLSGADLSGCDLRAVDWTKANLKGAHLVGAIFDGIDFTKAPYASVLAAGSTFFAGADLTSASFVGATFTGLSFPSTVVLSRANFTKANLQSVSFAQSIDLRGANFTFADLQQAQMPNAFLGVSDEDFTADPTLAANLSYAYMPGANLDHADLRHVNLSAVHLYGTGSSGKPASVSGALLGNANFGQAILSGLDLSGTQLQNAIFQGAQLVGCPFTNANLTNVNFQGAHLEGANFTGANMASAKLTNAALARRGDFGTYTNQVLVYNGTQWTCQPTSTQKWCGKPAGTWSYTEQNGIPYTVTFTETVLNASGTTTCPNAAIGGCTSVDQLTPIMAPFPPVPDCVPSPTNWCSPSAGAAQ